MAYIFGIPSFYTISGITGIVQKFELRHGVDVAESKDEDGNPDSLNMYNRRIVFDADFVLDASQATLTPGTIVRLGKSDSSSYYYLTSVKTVYQNDEYAILSVSGLRTIGKKIIPFSFTG